MQAFNMKVVTSFQVQLWGLLKIIGSFAGMKAFFRIVNSIGAYVFSSQFLFDSPHIRNERAIRYECTI